MAGDMSPSIRPAHVAPVCITAPVVSGIGETEVLERIVLDLADLIAAGEAADLIPDGLTETLETVVLTKRVTITDCEVFTNKVLVNGVLHKDLLFKFAATTQPTDGVIVTNGDCTLQVAATLDVVIDCPFGACITVPGACPGDTCFVELACVDAEKDLLIDTDADGVADLFEEKVCILIRVKSIRTTQLTITPDEDNICPTFPPTPMCNNNTGCINTGLQTTTFVSRPFPGSAGGIGF